MPEPGRVEARPGRPQNAENVVPLALGGFPSGPAPFQLAQDGVLRGCHGALDGIATVRPNLAKRAAPELGPAVIVPAQGKQVELPGGCEMDEIRGASPGEGLANEIGVGVEIGLQRGGEVVLCGTGRRNLEAVEDFEQAGEGLSGLWHGRTAPHVPPDPSRRRGS